MLPLAEIKEGHNGSFLVLWWITFEDLFYEPLILWGEFEGDGGVIVVGISVLMGESVGRMGMGALIFTYHCKCFAADWESR
jgi:hypothetical protein